MKYLVLVISLLIIIQCQEQEKPAMIVNLNPPEESTQKVLDEIKDLDKIENENRKGAEEDYEDEKKKLFEIQRARLRDIVKGSFVVFNGLMVNPIKAQIRSAISKAINGKTSSSSGEINTDQARASLDTSSETNMINSATKNLADQAAALQNKLAGASQKLMGAIGNLGGMASGLASQASGLASGFFKFREGAKQNVITNQTNNNNLRGFDDYNIDYLAEANKINVNYNHDGPLSESPQ